MDVTQSHERRTVVLGASGYIGTRLLSAAAKVGPAVGTSSSGRNGLLRLDLAALTDFDYSSINGRDTIFLTAAISNPDRCANEYAYCHSVNVVGAGSFIARALDKGARVIFLSSDTVYGEAVDPIGEDEACSPAGAYGAMKFEVEARFRGQPGFKAARLSYVFSKDDKFTAYLVKCAESGRPAEIFHPFVRRVVHLGDVVEGLLAMGRDWQAIPEGMINFGGPAEVSRLSIAECLKRLVFAGLEITVVEPPSQYFKDRPRRINMASGRLERILGRPPRSIESSIHYEFLNGDR